MIRTKHCRTSSAEMNGSLVCARRFPAPGNGLATDSAIISTMAIRVFHHSKGVLQFQIFEFHLSGQIPAVLAELLTRSCVTRGCSYFAFKPFYHNHGNISALSHELYLWDTLLILSVPLSPRDIFCCYIRRAYFMHIYLTYY
jgi:hypothetical protein